MADILTVMSKADQLDYSQNFLIARKNFLGDTIFPDIKTENFMAEWLRLSADAQLPTMALVHGLDTEAHIASRAMPEKVTTEKLLIKEKINQSERLRLLRDHGVADTTALTQYVFNDWARLAESVRCRTEVAKMDVLASGKMLIKENGISQTVDFGVPSANLAHTIDASATTKDVIGAILSIVEAAQAKGITITGMVTSSTVLQNIMKNGAVSTMVHGAAGSGALVTRSQLSALFTELFGFGAIYTNDLRYNVENKNGTKTATRYYPANKISFIGSVDGVANFGTGLWGVTPEEESLGQWTDKSAEQFITLTQWATNDPVTVWSKASAMFVPVLPNPEGLLVATVTLPS